MANILFLFSLLISVIQATSLPNIPYNIPIVLAMDWSGKGLMVGGLIIGGNGQVVYMDGTNQPYSDNYLWVLKPTSDYSQVFIEQYSTGAHLFSNQEVHLGLTLEDPMPDQLWTIIYQYGYLTFKNSYTQYCLEYYWDQVAMDIGVTSDCVNLSDLNNFYFMFPPSNDDYKITVTYSIPTEASSIKCTTMTAMNETSLNNPTKQQKEMTYSVQRSFNIKAQFDTASSTVNMYNGTTLISKIPSYDCATGFYTESAEQSFVIDTFTNTYFAVSTWVQKVDISETFEVAAQTDDLVTFEAFSLSYKFDSFIQVQYLPLNLTFESSEPYTFQSQMWLNFTFVEVSVPIAAKPTQFLN